MDAKDVQLLVGASSGPHEVFPLSNLALPQIKQLRGINLSTVQQIEAFIGAEDLSVRLALAGSRQTEIETLLALAMDSSQTEIEKQPSPMPQHSPMPQPSPMSQPSPMPQPNPMPQPSPMPQMPQPEEPEVKDEAAQLTSEEITQLLRQVDDNIDASLLEIGEKLTPGVIYIFILI